MIPLNYHHLYYFYVIARSGTMVKASEQLLLNQSTLSLQLKQFEKRVGRPLFDRRKQRLFLTPKGRQVLNYARRIFEIGNELEGVLGQTAMDRPATIEVGVLNATPRSFGHALLRGLRTFDANAHLVLREGTMDDLLQDLREFRLEAILTDVSIRSSDREEFDNHLLAKVPIVLAAAPALARRIRSIPRDLDGAPFVLPSSPSQLYRQILDVISEWKVKPRIVAEIQDIELSRRLALSGEGIAPLNAYTVSVSLPRGGLRIVGPETGIGLFESVYLVTRKGEAGAPLATHLQKHLELTLPAIRHRPGQGRKSPAGEKV